MPVEPVAVRAEQVEGLREMILEVLTEIEERRVPRELLIDVEALRRSPAGTLIRMENEIQRLSEGQEALWKSLEALRAEMKEGQEALWKAVDDLRTEMRAGQEALRAEMKEGQAALRAEMRAGQEALRAEMKEGQAALRAEMREGQETLRAEFRRELANLESVMEARFAAIDARFAAVDQRFDQLEQRLARTDFWIKFFAGLISALFTAQLVLTFIR
jgi:chromosome segregation ATPase